MQSRIVRAGVAVAMLLLTGCAVAPDQATAPVDDTAITAHIKARLVESPDQLMACVTVEALYGVVLLSGATISPQAKAQAQSIAGLVEGVRAVHNDISIQPEPSCRKVPVQQI